MKWLKHILVWGEVESKVSIEYGKVLKRIEETRKELLIDKAIYKYALSHGFHV